MRLTKSDKEAFVRAVMDDVPQIDYDTPAQKLVKDALMARMPLAVHNAAIEHSEWVKTNRISLPSALDDFYYFALNYTTAVDISPELKEQLLDLAARSKEQVSARDVLEGRIKAIISSHTTLKSAKAALPEFAKYLPADRSSTGMTGLPVANVVTDLIAAGWPK